MNKTITNGSNLPAVFSYGENKKVTIITIEDQPWFIAKDVCTVLGLTHAKNAVKVLDADERNIITSVDSKGRRCLMLAVNESGLYNLIFRSNKTEAKLFRKWVTNEVLPALRKTGSYQAPVVKEVKALPVVPEIFEQKRQEFRKNVSIIIINGTVYYKSFDLSKIIHKGSKGGLLKQSYLALTITKALKEGDAITIRNGQNHDVYWINYFAVKEILENSKTREGMLLYLALFETGNNLTAPVLPQSTIQTVTRKLLKGDSICAS